MPEKLSEVAEDLIGIVVSVINWNASSLRDESERIAKHLNVGADVVYKIMMNERKERIKLLRLSKMQFEFMKAAKEKNRWKQPF